MFLSVIYFLILVKIFVNLRFGFASGSTFLLGCGVFGGSIFITGDSITIGIDSSFIVIGNWPEISLESDILSFLPVEEIRKTFSCTSPRSDSITLIVIFFVCKPSFESASVAFLFLPEVVLELSNCTIIVKEILLLS